MGKGSAIMSTGGLLAVAAAILAGRPGPPPPTTTQELTTVAPPTNGPLRTGRQLLAAHTGRRLDDGVPYCTAGAQCDLDILIATLPDPFDSALDWGFDAYLESIRRAFEVAGFITDRFYLPGGTDSITLPVNRALADTAPADTVRRLTREVRPGVVLFRSVESDKTHLRLLYVVHEIPTSGIYREAMQYALRERRQLLGYSLPQADTSTGAGTLARANSPRRTDTLRILGPTFSGSARSLDAAIAYDSADVIQVISGTATDSDNARIFQDTVPNRLNAVRFNATVHTDHTLLSVLANHVLEPLGICRDRVAVLRETTSQYAVAASSQTVPATSACPINARPVLDIAFPMNIASLRGEFARIPEAPPSMKLPPLSVRESRVPLSLQDPARRRDTPASYSSLTPAALEQSLAEIVRTLRAREISVVVLLGTDVRDKLFLASELKKQLRDVRLVTFESNALYLHGRYARDLRGMIVLSTYPLILENQRWSADRNRLIPFASEGAVGVFNAASMLLGKDSEVLEYSVPFFADSTGATHYVPPVWITAVGRESLLPIRAVDARDSGGYVRASGGAAPPSPIDFHSMSFLLLFAILGASLLTIGVASTQSRPGESDLMKADICLLPTGRVDDGLASATPAPAGPLASTQLRERIAAEFKSRRETAPALSHYIPGYDLIEDGSLVIHRRLYSLWMLVGLAGMAFPLLGLAGGTMIGVLRSDEPYPSEGMNLFAGGLVALAAIAAVVTWTLAMARGSASLARLVDIFRPIGGRFAQQIEGRSWKFTLKWWGEILLRFLVAVIGLLYLVLVLVYAGAAFVAGIDPDPQFTLFFHRAMQIDGGLSPILTLAMIGLGCLAWGAWHRRRIRLLLHRTPFERALQAACSSSGWPLPAAQPGSRAENGASAMQGGPLPSRLDAIIDRLISLRVDVRPHVSAHDAIRDERSFYDVSLRATVASAETPFHTAEVVELGAAAHQSATATLDEPVCDEGARGNPPPNPAAGAGGVNGADNRTGGAVSSVFVRTVEGVVGVAHEIRQRLFYVVPPPHGEALFIALLLVFVWLIAQLGRTLESVAAQGTGPLVFEIIYKAGVVAAIAVTAWCTYRLRAVWEAVMRLLAELADTPLLPAFRRLPRRLTRLTRTRLLPGEPQPSVPAVARQQWQYLANIYRQSDARAGIEESLSSEGRLQLASLMTRPLTWRYDFKRTKDPRRYALAGRDEAEALRGLTAIVAELWSVQPTEEQIREEIEAAAYPARRETDRKEGEQDLESSTDRLRRRFAGATGLWLQVAEEFLAGGVAEYIESIQTQIRHLGWFLLVSTLLGTALLSSYPFAPQALFKVLFLAVLLITVVSLVMLVTEMNRNEVLSQIDRTTPGVVNWNTSFVLSLVFYGAVPLIAVLTSQFAPVRDALFAWVEPLMHTVGKF